MAMTPSMRILNPKYYKYKPMVASKSEFNIFIWNKIKFLADELKRIRQNTNVKETLFDDATNKFVKTIEEAKKDADGNHDLILDRIFGKNPHQFFATMDQFLWKIDDKKLEEVEQKNGEILKKYTEKGNVSNHSKENVFMVPDEYINLRKIINKFINRLKIEIVYGQSFGAILEIEENSKYKQIFKINFDEMENEAKNFVHKKEGKIRKLKKEIREEGSKKLEEKFIKLAKRKMKDIPNKYNELYLYNLLNNAIIDLQKMLVELVAEIVDGKKNGIHGSLVLVELIVKPMLQEVFDEATTMPDTTETRNFVEEIVGKDKIRTICLRNIKGSSGIYNRISEKFKGKDNDSNEIPVEFFKFDYDLVEMIKQNLGLPSDFLKIENFIVANTIKKEEKRMAVRKSKIRIAATKLLLVYERLKAMFYEEEELNENEKKNAQEITEHLSQIYMEPIPTKRFGELLYKYLFENLQKV